MGWVLGGVVLGVLARDPILSPWFPALGLALARWQRGFARRRRAAQESTPHALALTRGVANFLRGAVGPALSDAAQRLPDGPVRERALRACRRYATGAPWDEALRDLTGLNPLLDRLALLLAAAPRMGEAAVRKALDDLAREAAAREALEAETGAELVLLKLTVRFLLVANLVALAASLLVPAWHDFFTSTLARRGTVMAANLLVAGAYVYFSEEIAALREAI
jgi:Flp pilus assembly protein TadB